jgi:uncharacterized protein with HEPN domain
MRPEELYLLDIIEAAEAIERFCAPVTEVEFLVDELRQSAVLQKLIVIGEAASHLPADFRKRHNTIEWEDIIGFRNIAVHEYFAVLWEIVWNTAFLDVPGLHKKVQLILTDEFHDNMPDK